MCRLWMMYMTPTRRAMAKRRPRGSARNSQLKTWWEGGPLPGGGRAAGARCGVAASGPLGTSMTSQPPLVQRASKPMSARLLPRQGTTPFTLVVVGPGAGPSGGM